jgi:DNA topoisomerase-6 subunit A
MFQRLQSHKYWDKASCILVSMAGVPTRATRRFVRRLSDQCKIGVRLRRLRSLRDLNIYRTLKVGSGNAAHQPLLLRPAGDLPRRDPQDIIDYKLPTHPLRTSTSSAPRTPENDPFFHIPSLARAMEMLLKMEVRAEQQALAKWGLNYVIEEYLPKKLKETAKFLP